MLDVLLLLNHSSFSEQKNKKHVEISFQCDMPFDHSFQLDPMVYLFVSPKFSAGVNKWKNIEEEPHWLVAVYQSRDHIPKTSQGRKFISYY